MPLDLLAAAVLLDMDGTLVDSTAVVETIWREFADEFGLDAARVLAFAHGRPTLDTVVEFLPGRDRRELADLARRIGAEETRRSDGVVEVAGAGAFVRALLDADVPVAMVTSASAGLASARMRAAGVPLPEVLVTPADVARGKPAPDGYLRAAGLLGVAASRCVAFEDAAAGVAAALAAGVATVLVGALAADVAAGLPRVLDLAGVTVTPAGGGAVRLRA